MFTCRTTAVLARAGKTAAVAESTTHVPDIGEGLNDARHVRGHAGCEAMPHAPMKAGILAKRLTKGQKAGRAQPGSGQLGVGCGKVALRQSLNLSLEAGERRTGGGARASAAGHPGLVAGESRVRWPSRPSSTPDARGVGGMQCGWSCFRPCLSGARVWGRRDATIACLRTASFRWRAYWSARANTAAARAVKTVTPKAAVKAAKSEARPRRRLALHTGEDLNHGRHP